jgi:hypothetical protein
VVVITIIHYIYYQYFTQWGQRVATVITVIRVRLLQLTRVCRTVVLATLCVWPWGGRYLSLLSPPPSRRGSPWLPSPSLCRARRRARCSRACDDVWDGVDAYGRPYRRIRGHPLSVWPWGGRVMVTSPLLLPLGAARVSSRPSVVCASVSPRCPGCKRMLLSFPRLTAAMSRPPPGHPLSVCVAVGAGACHRGGCLGGRRAGRCSLPQSWIQISSILPSIGASAARTPTHYSLFVCALPYQRHLPLSVWP